MSKCNEHTNVLTGQTYFASIVPTKKRMLIPMDLFGMPIEPLRFENLVFQVAVYPKGRIHPLFVGFTAPLFVINLDSPAGDFSEGELAELLDRMLVNERIEDLFSEDSCGKLWRDYGFEAVSHDIRSALFGFKKVRHIFIF